MPQLSQYIVCVFVFLYCICITIKLYLFSSLCCTLYENTKKEKERNVGRVKGCLGQSGIDAPAKSVSPQSVACPVTHTHTGPQKHKHKLYTNTHTNNAHISIIQMWSDCKPKFMQMWLKLKHISGIPIQQLRNWMNPSQKCLTEVNFYDRLSCNGFLHVFHATNCCLVEMMPHFTVLMPIRILSDIFARWACAEAPFLAPTLTLM